MDSRAWFFISAFTAAVLTVVTSTNCGADDSWPPQRVNGYVEGSSLEEPYDDAALDALCLENESGGNKEVIFTAPGMDETCEESGMESALASLSFTILENAPQLVLLYGRPSMQYCFGVLRLSGYITISHPHGEVHREGDRFTWCVVPTTDSPQHMIIRSLTPSASFTLAAKE